MLRDLFIVIVVLKNGKLGLYLLYVEFSIYPFDKEKYYRIRLKMTIKNSLAHEIESRQSKNDVIISTRGDKECGDISFYIRCISYGFEWRYMLDAATDDDVNGEDDGDDQIGVCVRALGWLCDGILRCITTIWDLKHFFLFFNFILFYSQIKFRARRK